MIDKGFLNRMGLWQLASHGINWRWHYYPTLHDAVLAWNYVSRMDYELRYAPTFNTRFQAWTICYR